MTKRKKTGKGKCTTRTRLQKIATVAFLFLLVCWILFISSQDIEISGVVQQNDKQIITNDSVMRENGKRRYDDSDNDDYSDDDGDVRDDPNRNDTRIGDENPKPAFLPAESLLLPTPILVMGFPKSGTSSVYDFFKCNNVRTSHYCCVGQSPHKKCQPEENEVTYLQPRHQGLCGKCIYDYLRLGKDPLEKCGIHNYDVFAQMDVEGVKNRVTRGDKIVSLNAIFLPQVKALDTFHKYYPNATFILNTRDPKRWAASVGKWFNMRINLLRTDLPEIGYSLTNTSLEETEFGFPAISRKFPLISIYLNHYQRIRDFVHDHPSHALVEVDIESDEAGKIMAESFGLDAGCWGHSNSNVNGSRVKEASERVKNRETGAEDEQNDDHDHVDDDDELK
mmetsp:Transcript_25361/g.31251  ORF Transcript_25361/g.31251 Transcript_25361/m.31251 type:complete len:393 (+) Transcript_25361:115-1293(+)